MFNPQKENLTAEAQRAQRKGERKRISGSNLSSLNIHLDEGWRRKQNNPSLQFTPCSHSSCVPVLPLRPLRLCGEDQILTQDLRGAFSCAGASPSFMVAKR